MACMRTPATVERNEHKSIHVRQPEGEKNANATFRGALRLLVKIRSQGVAVCAGKAVKSALPTSLLSSLAGTCTMESLSTAVDERRAV